MQGSWVGMSSIASIAAAHRNAHASINPCRMGDNGSGRRVLPAFRSRCYRAIGGCAATERRQIAASTVVRFLLLSSVRLVGAAFGPWRLANQEWATFLVAYEIVEHRTDWIGAEHYTRSSLHIAGRSPQFGVLGEHTIETHCVTEHSPHLDKNRYF